MTNAGEYRIYVVTTPFMSDDPKIAWADVKATAKQARIVRASDRGAWRYVTVLRSNDYPMSEEAAWARYADTLRRRIKASEDQIARDREHLALAERNASAASRRPTAPPEAPHAR